MFSDWEVMMLQTNCSCESFHRGACLRTLAAVVLLAAVGILCAGALEAQISIEARRLDMGSPQALQPAPGEVSVVNLDCDTPTTPNTNVCLQVRCDPCTTPIPDLGSAMLDADLTAGDLQNIIGTSDCVIRDTNVAVELTHSFVGDLIIDFDRPGVTGSTVYFPPGNCTATSVDALFSDESTRAPDACPAMNGLSYRPSDSLTVFDGRSAVGAYRLTVADVLGGDSGMVNRWGYSLALDCNLTPPAGCVENATTLCLNNDRFQVRTTWATPQGTSGNGQAVELTDDTGYFWFFNSTNVEMVVKVLNTCSFSNRFWVFAGGLTNVEVEMTVVDTQRGASRFYRNPQRTPFQPIQDTNAFATCP